eukprot:g6833.t1
MICCFVCGTCYAGSCDYFTYNNQEYHVDARMFYFQCWLVYVDHAILQDPFDPDEVLNVSYIPNIRMRCYLWAVARLYFLPAGLLALIIGLCSLDDSRAHAIFLITLGVIGIIAGISAIFYKPKASAKCKATYIHLLGGALPPGTVITIPMGPPDTSASESGSE